MFAKQIDFILNHAIVTCVLYQGDDKTKILDKNDFNKDLLSNIDGALAFLKKHNRVEYIISGSGPRLEVPEYPEEALREAVINAVCHRDYFQRGSRVMIEMYDNFLEISNPGGLPSGLSKKNFGKISIARNPILADLLCRSRYIEKVGSGISRISNAVKKHNGDIQYKISHDDFYIITFSKTNIDVQAEGEPKKRFRDFWSNRRRTTTKLPQNYH